jgi:Tol biopolymer transport system component
VIAFVQQYGGALSLMNADGTNVHVNTAPGRNYSEGLFSWSPDGVWLAARGPSSIELLNIDTGLVIPLGYTASYDSPAWRPS